MKCITPDGHVSNSQWATGALLLWGENAIYSLLLNFCYFIARLGSRSALVGNVEELSALPARVTNLPIGWLEDNYRHSRAGSATNRCRSVCR